MEVMTQRLCWRQRRHSGCTGNSGRLAPPMNGSFAHIRPRGSTVDAMTTIPMNGYSQTNRHKASNNTTMAKHISELLPAPPTDKSSLQNFSNELTNVVSDAKKKIPISGLKVYKLLPSIPPTDQQVEYARYILEQSFGKTDDFTWKEFELMMIDEGWTADWLKRSYRYILNKKSDWIPKGETQPRPVSINDFNRVPIPMLYPYVWYQERVQEHRLYADMIDCYALPDGRKGWGWKSDVGSSLPLYEPLVEEQAKIESVELNDDTRDFLTVTQENLRLHTELVEMTKERDRWKREYLFQRKIVEEWSKDYDEFGNEWGDVNPTSYEVEVRHEEL